MEQQKKQQGNKKPFNKNKQQNQANKPAQAKPVVKQEAKPEVKKPHTAVETPAKKKSLFKRIWCKIKRAFKWLFSK